MRGFTVSSCTAPFRATSRKRHGFTYVDAMIAVFIMGIAAAIATPRLSSAYQHHRVKSATANLAADLSYLRQQAFSQGRSLPSTFDSVSQTLSCPSVRSAEKNNAPFSRSLTDLVQDAKLIVVGLPPENAGAPKVFCFEFSRDGLTFDKNRVRKPNWGFQIQHSGATGVVKVTDEGIFWSMTTDG